MATDEPFNVVVDRWIVGAKENTRQLFAMVTSDVLDRLKELTPVRTGYLRANWTVTTDASVQPIQSQQGGGDALDFSLIDLQIGQRAIIVNPVVYARRVNYGFIGEDSLGRHYHQEGRHFVEQVVAEIPQIIAADVRKVTGR